MAKAGALDLRTPVRRSALRAGAILATLLAPASPCLALDVLIATSPTTHSVQVLSSWPTIKVSIIATVNLDASGIDVTGTAYLDDPAKISKTEIATVTRINNVDEVKSLKACSAVPSCDFTIPKTTMRPASNDVWFIVTLVDGQVFAATTKMSPPK